MLFGSSFLQRVPQYRVLWIRGRLGAGKTSFGVRLLYWFLDEGMIDRIWSNIPMSGQEEPSADTANDCGMLFDESWIALDARNFKKNDVHSWGAYLRKRNMYLILPSVWSVDVRFRALHIERTWAFGTRLWVYRYGVDLGYQREEGTLWWLNPREVLGTYDHKYQPTGSGGMLGALREAIDRERAKDGFEADFFNRQGSGQEQACVDEGAASEVAPSLSGGGGGSRAGDVIYPV